ncbi:MAG TPA: DUF2939 domain-containing protein [Telluria sp.]|jgi:hypothetical protein
MTDLGCGKYGLMLDNVPLAITSHDYKIWYTDAQGREVIVQWGRANTDAGNYASGYSDAQKEIMKAIHLKLGIAALCVTAGAAYWYYSPLIALHQMRAAARDHDAESFNARVDYPRLRESVKAQLNAAMNEQVKPGAGGDDLGKAGAALGKMLGMAMADKMVDAMVNPEFVMGAIERGSIDPRRKRVDQNEPAKPDPKYTSERIGLNTYILHLESDKPGQRGLSLVMERHGFASWKLADVRMPPAPASAPLN